jgi:transcription elongation factor S-II
VSTSASDGDYYYPEEFELWSKDSSRDNIRRKFIQILQTPPEGVNPDDWDIPLKTRAAMYGVQIEIELYKKFYSQTLGLSKGYNDRCRSLIFNLSDKKNPRLKINILGDDISPYDIANMDPKELASEELKKQRLNQQ